MQAVINPSPAQGLMHFFGRNYMMRSEKRSGMTPQNHAAPSGNGKRPPKRRRRRAGFFYKIATMLLLIVLWPVGLLLLWRRKLRWNISTKLMVCIVTLVACIVLYGFALTVDTGNPKYAAVQDSINTSLDSAADWLNGAGAFIGEKAGSVHSGIANFADALWQSHRSDIADLIDEGVRLADQVREGVTGAGQPETTPTEAPTEVPTEAPTETPTETPTQKPSKAPTATPSAKPSAEASDAPEATDTAEAADTAEVTGAPTLKPTGTPDATAAAKPTAKSIAAPTAAPEATEAPTIAPTDAPAVESTLAPDAKDVKVYIPTSAPSADSGRELTHGTLDRDGTFVEATPAAPQSVTVVLKPAKDAQIYYNKGGKYYHIAAKCKGMKKAAAHTLGEVADTKLEKCPNCESPERELLDETYIVWVDENNAAHTSDSCAAFEGQYRLIRAADADDTITPCAECGADIYLKALADGTEIILTSAVDDAIAEPEASADAALEPAETPAAQEITPTVALKSAGDAPVYHSRTGKWYHTYGSCSGMSYASVYTLAECVDNYKCCNACKAPKPELVGQHCLWQDQKKICHTSDDCTEFSGRYTLVLRDDALEKERTGCSVCGADEYLIPGTTIHYLEDITADDPV